MRPGRNMLLLVGAVVLAIGLWNAVDVLRFVNRSIPTSGTVVSREGHTYRVAFTVDGQPHAFDAPMPSRALARTRIQVGLVTSIRYVPGSPEDARVADGIWVFPAVMLAVGAFALLGAFGIVRK